MARTLFRLTEKMVRHCSAPGYHADGGGLYLQVSKSGTKSWIFRFTVRGRTRDMGLGPFHSASLSEARAKAAECRALVAKGSDPIDYAKSQPALPSTVPSVDRNSAGPTFGEFAEEFIDARASSWTNKKHRDQWRSSLARYAYPVIGNMRLDEIETPHILRIIEPIWQEKSETASRVRGRIERILAAASVRGLRPATNPAGWVGHLREALPPKRGARPFSALAYNEIHAFLAALRRKESVTAYALEFAILTAARSSEVRNASWSEIDLLAKTWTIPSGRMKAKRDHVVPLSDAALAVLERVKPLRDLAGEFLFPGMKHARPLSDATLGNLVQNLGYDVTAHGFRATFKTWAEQETDHPNVVIEAALAHIVGDKAERAYMRGDWLAKRRLLMRDWGEFCLQVSNGTVVPYARNDRSAAA